MLVTCWYLLLAALDILPIVGSERVTWRWCSGSRSSSDRGGPRNPRAVTVLTFLCWLRVGTTFLIVAFALLNLMLVVQQMVRLQFRQFRLAAGDASQAALLDAVFKGTNLIQLGIDVSFDVFYCLGVIALSAVMYREPGFGRVLGAFGIVSAAALLVFNLATFPYGPADSGLVDLGPVTGIWWLCVIVQIKRNAARSASNHAGAE